VLPIGMALCDQGSVIDTPNLDSMKDAAQALLDAGFEITAEIPDDQKAFGNAMLDLEASDLVVRMVIDRSKREVRIGAASARDAMVDLGPALAQLDAPNPGAVWPTFDEAVQALLLHRASLPGAIGPARAGPPAIGTQKLLRRRR
jgi:hypothetical protein